MNDTRIKICAIAKDEAAYLPEWIFHHLHFGFDHIEVLINRTNDNSEAVLQRIVKISDQVSYRHYDWLDLCPDSVQKNIQYIAYADAYERAKSEGYTHIFLIDIDELWTPRDFDTSIKQLISRIGTYSSVSFNWYCELGLKEEFTPISQKLHYFPNEHIKTLTSFDSPVLRVKIHAPIFGSGALHCLADGSTFEPRDAEGQFHAHKTHTDDSLPAFVIHRMYRSELEYISSLLRGNPNSNENIGSLFKDNRHGFKTESATSRVLTFPPGCYSDYREKFSHFLVKADLHQSLDSARQYILDRAESAIKAAAELFILDPGRAKKIFSGCQSKDLQTLQAPDHNILNYKIDAISDSGGVTKVVGWAVSRHPHLPVRFFANGLDQNLQIEFIERPDINSLFGKSAANSGFKIIIPSSSLQDNSETSGILSIGLPAMIQTSHASNLYYNSSTSQIEHIPKDEPSNSLGKFPLFFATIFGSQALAAYVRSQTLILKRDPSGQIILTEQGTLDPEDALISKVMLDKKSFALSCNGKYASAIKSGPIVINRVEPKAWETFHEENSFCEKISLNSQPK